LDRKGAEAAVPSGFALLRRAAAATDRVGPALLHAATLREQSARYALSGDIAGTGGAPCLQGRTFGILPGAEAARRQDGEFGVSGRQGVTGGARRKEARIADRRLMIADLKPDLAGQQPDQAR